MVFSSHLFVFYFLPLALAVYYLTPVRGRNLLLTVVSYVFYGWANPLFTVLMLASTLIDYAAGRVMGWVDAWPDAAVGGSSNPARATAWRRRALVCSLASNLLLLGFFKYFNFGIDSYNGLTTWLGLGDLRLDRVLRITLPLGISFYTFQSMSYAIDVYRRHAAPIRNFVDFACFVSMFPQLVAGPIIRFAAVAEQLRQRSVTLEKFARGVAFFGVGLAKKVLLANPCGKVADTVFGSGAAGAADSWYGAVAYAFQIYFDFSGYSDMAVGLGLMLGFVFARNFDSPYRSASITEFWRRWHISLSSWLRDYLYIPLGGSRRGPWRTYANLLIVMLLGGLWHGAAWTFVVWGGIHGLALAAERMRGKDSLLSPLPRPLRVAATFGTVLLGWVFFRSPDIASALDFCGRMLGLAGDAPAGAALVRGIVLQPYYVLTVAAAAMVTWGCPQTWEWTERLSGWKVVAALALLWAAIAVLATQSYNPFIYFIF